MPKWSECNFSHCIGAVIRYEFYFAPQRSTIYQRVDRTLHVHATSFSFDRLSNRLGFDWISSLMNLSFHCGCKYFENVELFSFDPKIAHSCIGTCRRCRNPAPGIDILEMRLDVYSLQNKLYEPTKTCQTFSFFAYLRCSSFIKSVKSVAGLPVGELVGRL
jgi:hypothetical protein